MAKVATRTAALGAVLCVLAAGCSGHRHTASTGPTGPPVRGGTLTYSDVQFVTDTMAANYSANNLMFQLLDRVVYVDPKTDAVRGWLAKPSPATRTPPGTPSPSATG